MPKKHPKLFLIDASSLIFRAFFAIRNLSTSKGLPTNAVYGYTTMLLGVMDKYKPDYIACIFDTPKPTFRKELFPDYKAHRGPPPDDLIPQFDLVQRVTEALGIVRLAEPGFEADDLIATLARLCEDCDITIVTGDKDLMQLVDNRVKVLDTMKNITYGPAEVKEKLGIEPRLVTDYLGLIGDTSDNIPGIPGVGPKTAVELINEYGDIEKVLAAAPKMKPGRRRDLLIEHAEVIHVSVGAQSPDIVLVRNEREWAKCLEKLASQPVLAFDTETRGERTTEIEMVGMSLCGDGREAFYIPVRHQGEGTDDQVSSKKVVADFDLLIRDKMVIAQNLKYDYKVLLAEGLEVAKPKGGWFDTMLAHYLVEPEEKHGLDALAARYLNAQVGDFKEVLGERPDFSLVPLTDAARYGGLDAWSTCRLYEPLAAELKRVDVEKLFHEIEMPTALVLAHMEWNGVAVDTEVLGRLSEEFGHELKSIEHDIFDLVGHPMNLNSPKQLAQVLFGELGLPPQHKTKTGFSTDITVLQKLAHLHAVPALMVRFRELAKLKGTYTDVIPTLIEKDGRVHTSFNQAVAETGRLSSSNPNVQQIPIKTESGNKIRRAFVAGPGNALVGADYSQIELRLVAHLSGDRALIDAFNARVDVHRATAAEIFHVKPEAVTDQQRGAAKAINFGLIYGKTPFGLAQELNISRTEAQRYIEAYFRRYSGVKAYMDKCLMDARETGVAQTLFGRKRPLKDIENRNAAVRNNAERMAMNTPVQGTAADIIKIAMIKADESCRRMGCKLVLQVHDELLLDVPKAQSKEAAACLTKDMEGVAKLAVPLDVNVGIAQNWMEL
ncbi:MAG: DNA polymerase I [Deltaproteobacteria bacterium]|nr:DNA polymerase I [Deltaproteobacteria bacterium]